MNRHAPRNLRHQIGGYQAASRLVRHVADQWCQGMPLRLACKILRKQGIHAWSLLVPVEGDQRAHLIQHLKPPCWFTAALLDPLLWEEMRGMFFKQLPKGVRLPDGLVLPYLGLLGSPFLRRLPNRIWAWRVLVAGCEALESLPAFVSRPGEVDVSRCPRLKFISAASSPLHQISVEECDALEAISLPAGFRSPRNLIHLSDLPRLEKVVQGGTIQNLSVRNCPRLRSLGDLTVDGQLQIHRCQSLGMLPRFEGMVTGRITDCLKLSELDVAGALPGEGSTLKVQPWRGAHRLPPIQRIAASGTPAMTPLLPVTAFEDGPAWPWPPLPSASMDPSVDRTLNALGISSLERLWCQVQPDLTLSDILHGHLSMTRHPGEALLLLRDWLGEATGKTDALSIDLLLHQAGRYGFGPVSIWLVLSNDQKEAMLPWLPSWWRVRLSGTSNLEDVSEALDGIPGPLVIANRLATYTAYGLGPKAIEGPLWVGGDLSVEDWSELESLPDLVVVKGDLRIAHCPALRRFPRRLEVEGDLYIEDLPRLERSVCRASVTGEARVMNCPALRLVPLGSWEQ